jgi:hypothetical protein
MLVTRDASNPASTSSVHSEHASTRGPLASVPDDEIDPELLSLPDPPRRGRTFTLAVLGVTALASLAMVFALRRDALYAVAPATPADVGDLRVAQAGALAGYENRLVTAHGMVGAAGGIRYERPFSEGSFRALPIAGRPDVWVEVRVPDGKENGRWEPPKSFAGRLKRFDASGPRHRGLASAVKSATDEPVRGDAWLLVDGEAPATSRWPLALSVLFLAFAAWNVMTIRKLVRKVA